MGRPCLNFDDQYAPVPEAGCWIWLGGVNRDGYGNMSGSRRAHRVSYERSIGPIPDGALVCHRCDVPLCVNPSHLFLGTPADNTNDMVAKGRQCRGERHKMAKLSASDVGAILASDEPCFILAARHGVSDTSISFIRLGKTWKHVPRPLGYAYKPYRAPATHETWQELNGP